MIILQFSRKLYEVCDGANPKLLSVNVTTENEISASITIEVDGSPVTLGLPLETKIADIVKLKHHVGEFVILKSINQRECSIVGFKKVITQDDELTPTSESVDDSVIPDLQELKESTESQETIPDIKTVTPESNIPDNDTTKKAGASNRTRGCSFKNREF